VVLAGLVGVIGWQGWVQGSAWAHLRRGRAALDRGDPAAARDHLDRTLTVWPGHAEAHFLAARAARKVGDPKAARDHLRKAHESGWPDDEVGPELVLADLARGDVAEPALLRLVAAGHPDSADILAVLVPGYLAAYRVAEAEPLSRKWVELRPESAEAWSHRADILERLRLRPEAREAAREAVRLDPGDRAARLRLARLLLETRQPPDEAAGLLEPLLAANPDDPDARVLLAAGRQAQGRPDDALALLDPLTTAPAANPKALLLRGRLLLDAGRPADALPALRRAAAADPSDPEALFTLFQCLQQTGPADEARAAEDRWRRCTADLARVNELGRAVAAAPNDPDLRREMGELFLRNGRAADGVRWLESALKVAPDHAPTHRLLADHHARTGRPDLAARHRAAAEGGGNP
jgi:tetratricopeptide (TPR) repeat protein